MVENKSLPHGTWPSKITPGLTGDLREFSELSWSGDGDLLWLERHSNRASLMAWDYHSGQISKLSGNLNVGGGIMYGGGSYSVQKDQVVFIEKKSNLIYHRTSKESNFQKIITSPYYKSSPQFSPDGNDLVFICSDGENDTLQILNLPGNGESKTLLDNADFFNYPRWHPDGTQFAWISWKQPAMPWQDTRLNLVDQKLSPGAVLKGRQISLTERSRQVSIVQPEFSPDGKLLAYLSDENGWWQIYIYQIDTGKIIQVTNAEADYCLPPWVQNQSFYAFSPGGEYIYCIRNSNGFASLWKVDIADRKEKQIQLSDDYSWLESIAVSPQNGWIALVASGGRVPSEILILKTDQDYEAIRHANTSQLDPELFSQPEAKSWKVDTGTTLHGLFYKPHNPEYSSVGKPPMIVIVHSGPTRQKYAEFQPRAQYFASRGYAVLEVNYRGSTGYGRDYWEALERKWGIVDVEDVYNVARYISQKDLIDPARIILLGSSSGGLTVLQLLIKYPEFFRAGISLYGVTNLTELFKNPPKFERYYHHWLVGDPETEAAEYQSRSPLNFADKIRTPIAIFQGGKDPIVPQEQAEQLVKALQINGIPHEYHLYPDEGHSFKNAQNVNDFYRKTDMFLRKYVNNI
jgi:dipeptidyl aminopeptidase/acylaminoacyl peptidase